MRSKLCCSENRIVCNWLRIECTFSASGITAAQTISATPATRKSHPGSGLKNGRVTRIPFESADCPSNDEEKNCRNQESKSCAKQDSRTPQQILWSASRWRFDNRIHRIENLPQLHSHRRSAPQEVIFDPPIAALNFALSRKNERCIGQNKRARVE